MNGANMHLPALKKTVTYPVAAFLIALLFCTYLRISFLFLYPLFALLFYYGFKWKLDKNAVSLLIFAFICWLLSFRNGVYLKYNVISFYYFLPFILLLFAMPREILPVRNYLHPLMHAITAVMIINNVFGVVQYMQHPYDDSFQGIYGTFTVSQNGLSIINSVLFFYHITMYQHRNKDTHLVLALFFIICSVMGFYGAGLIAFIGAYVLTFLRMRWKNIIVVALSLVLVVGIAYLVMKIVSPLVLDYNVNIIKKFLDPNAPGAPRKIIIFRNYIEGYSQNIWDLLFGSGPGTFNSRTAFSVGSPTYFQVEFIKSPVQPEYFRDYAYTLWNPSNTGPYDGFMNQPFTSLLALLGEYGLLFTLGVVYVVVGRFRNAVRYGRTMAKQVGMSTEFKMFRFCMLFAMILLVIDNYMEYPEIIALLLILAKLGYQQMKSAITAMEAA